MPNFRVFSGLFQKKNKNCTKNSCSNFGCLDLTPNKGQLANPLLLLKDNQNWPKAQKIFFENIQKLPPLNKIWDLYLIKGAKKRRIEEILGLKNKKRRIEDLGCPKN